MSDLSVEMIDKGDALVVVDVRQPEEYAAEAGHLPGAFNIPLRDLAKNLDALPNVDAEIVVYCGSGWRSVYAMTALQVAGYTNVRSMSGGFRAWTAEEFAVETESVEAMHGEAPALDVDVLAAVDAALSGIPEGWAGITADNLNIKLIEDAPDLLIDVRTPGEWADGYIPGATHMTLQELVSFADVLPADLDADIVVYCKAGHRGNMAATILRVMGYTNVLNLGGGFTAWAGAEYEVVMPEGGAAMNALLAYNESLPAGYGNVTVSDLSVEMIDKGDALVVVDVRQPEEYTAEAGHLPGAFNIPLRELAQNLDALPDPHAEIVVYCGSGWRSVYAMTALQVAGYTNVRSMKGGFRAWTAEEFAVETEPVEAPALDADVLAAVDAALAGIPEGWAGITAEDLNIKLIEDAPDLLIDVRKPEEWGAGYIPSATHMQLEELMSFAGELPADLDADIVVYCKAGHRGNMAATMLRIMGYTNVLNLGGGFTAWAGADLEVEMP
ncbi:MAG: rhodanese-like domain-containing protein [Anaerolineae bacterium]|nr:rhodanese-like domain-containing protein [Anaerolineae bacterium]